MRISMIAIECDDWTMGQKLPADWWAEVLLAESMGKDVTGFAPTLAAEAQYRKALDSMGIQTGVLRHPAELAQVRCLLARSPTSMARHAWLRQAAVANPTSWSLVTLVDEAVVARWPGTIAQLAVVPIYPWDAIVCTSRQVRSQVLWLFKAQMALLTQRFGVNRLVMPEVVVIHPGLYPDRRECERTLGWTIEQARGPGQTAILIRDHDDEALALTQALQLLAADGFDLSRLLVVQAGPASLPVVAPGASVLRLPAASGDRFASLARHVDIVCLLPTVCGSQDAQDMLGAMAEGAPLVCADMGLASDLCRDLASARVRPDAGGVKISTMCAPAAADGVLAYMSSNADGAQGHLDLLRQEVSAVTVIDVAELALALRELVESEDLRDELRRRGPQVASECSWAAGMNAFRELRHRLRDVAVGSNQGAARGLLPDPAHPDPLHLQEVAVTRVLEPDTRLALAQGIDAGLPVKDLVRRAGELFKASRISASRMLPSVDELAAVIDVLKRLDEQRWPGVAARDLVAGINPARQVHVFRSILWAVRIGLLQVLKPAHSPASALDRECEPEGSLFEQRPRA
jgi:hypothetical protein